MMSMGWKRVKFIVSILVSLLLIACGGSSGGGSGGTGELAISLIDATLYEYQAVYVTIDEIQVHRDIGGGWETVASPQQTFNLLELVNGVREDLGLATLDTGHYTQMRLIIGDTPDDSLNIFSETHPFPNYVILSDDTIHELNVPGGPKTGVKLVNGFDINTNQTTELILDFEASKSVVEAGSSGQWHLKPTIKVLETLTAAIVDGTVTKEGTGEKLEGVLVSAQLYSSNTELDEKDSVTVDATTVTDANGEYALFLPPGNTYNLVAFAEGYVPGCVEVETFEDTVQTEPFELTTSTENGTIGGNVTITNGSPTQHVTISFRQVVTCNSEPTTIEVTTRNIANNSEYSVDLPAGNYRVVVSTFGKTTVGYDIELTDLETETLNFIFD